ncbi:unnamed protein product [Closterium sp. Naga37s-1]|nr:unnamed protein product [Closterium sp. Naga37s-1]
MAGRGAGAGAGAGGTAGTARTAGTGGSGGSGGAGINIAAATAAVEVDNNLPVTRYFRLAHNLKRAVCRSPPRSLQSPPIRFPSSSSLLPLPLFCLLSPSRSSFFPLSFFPFSLLIRLYLSPLIHASAAALFSPICLCPSIADVYRCEGNTVQLYVFLLRFISMVLSTMPQHRDARAPQHAKEIATLNKQAMAALLECEQLKPQVSRLLQAGRGAHDDDDGDDTDAQSGADRDAAVRAAAEEGAVPVYYPASASMGLPAAAPSQAAVAAAATAELFAGAWWTGGGAEAAAATAAAAVDPMDAWSQSVGLSASEQQRLLTAPAPSAPPLDLLSGVSSLSLTSHPSTYSPAPYSPAPYSPAPYSATPSAAQHGSQQHYSLPAPRTETLSRHSLVSMPAPHAPSHLPSQPHQHHHPPSSHVAYFTHIDSSPIQLPDLLPPRLLPPVSHSNIAFSPLPTHIVPHPYMPTPNRTPHLLHPLHHRWLPPVTSQQSTPGDTQQQQQAGEGGSSSNSSSGGYDGQQMVTLIMPSVAAPTSPSSASLPTAAPIQPRSILKHGNAYRAEQAAAQAASAAAAAAGGGAYGGQYGGQYGGEYGGAAGTVSQAAVGGYGYEGAGNLGLPVAAPLHQPYPPPMEAPLQVIPQSHPPLAIQQAPAHGHGHGGQMEQRQPHPSDVADPRPGKGGGKKGIKAVHISTRMMDDFMRIVRHNTSRNLETCAVLGGVLKKGLFFIKALILPKQESTSDSCSTLNEEEIFEAQDKRGLFQLGWIHTHPSQACFMSSIDLHTHYSYQVMLPEAIAIVMAPKDPSRPFGIFQLSQPGGVKVIQNCQQRGFHTHEAPADGTPLYSHSSHVFFNPRIDYEVLDLR